jgi:hypothetical protein
MTAVYSSITEANALTALRTFILSVVDCEVIRAPANRAAMPAGDFIALTPIFSAGLATNVHSYTDTTKKVLRSEQFAVQVDCYGASSANRARTVALLFRDDVAVQSFKSSGFDMVPLYAGDAKQMPIISGEEQYIERWTFECVMQLNPVITLTQETANTLEAGLINVDRVYAP